MSKPAWGKEENVALPQFAHVTALGHYKRAFTKNGGSQSAVVIMGAGVAIAVLGAVVGVSTGEVFSAAPFVPFALVFFVAGALQSRSARLVATYHEGFAALVGSRVQTFRWNEIASLICNDRYVTGKRTAWTSHRCEVRKANGEKVTLLSVELEDGPVLIGDVKKHVASILLPDLRRSYDAGDSLSFGPLVVSKKIIERRGQRVDWSAVGNVVMKNGKLIVTPKSGKPFSVRVSKIPNVDLLCELIGVTYLQLDLAYIF
ncbi:MAG: DUF6585 family protein [Polyangiaceae bacterium]